MLPIRFLTRPYDLALLVGISVAYGLVYLFGALHSPSGELDWGKLQLFCFPLLLASFARIDVAGVGIPRPVLAVSIAGALCGAVFTYTNVDLVHGAFVVARFQDDELESETRITRDRIRAVVGERALALVGSYHEPVSTSEQATALLSADPHLGGVAWGTPRWLSVSLSGHPDVAVGTIMNRDSARRGSRLSGLSLITSVGQIGLSGSSSEATVEFIGRLVPLWSKFGNLVARGEMNNQFEQDVRTLAAVKARWTSFSHRALPMWMTGTYHIARAVSGDEIERGELFCARTAFEASLAQLRPGDNAELEAAVLNNYGVAVLVDALVSDRPKHRRQTGIAFLRRALFVAGRGRAPRVAAIARANVLQMKRSNGDRKKRASRRSPPAGPR